MTTHISNHSLNNEECVCVLSRLPSLSTVSVETLLGSALEYPERLSSSVMFGTRAYLPYDHLCL